MDVKIKRYIKKLPYSYAYGTYPTIDLLTYKPDKVIKVLIHSAGRGSEGLDRVIELCDKNNIVYEEMDLAIERISAKDNTYCIGVFEKYSEELNKAENHIVLDRPKNMGNIGTIIRTMVGFGYTNLAMLRPCADVFDPMIVRSAMGALFQIKIEYFDNLEEYTRKYNDHINYLFLLDGSKDIEKIELKKPYSLVFGNESEGLPKGSEKFGEPVFIKQGKNIDSLNLSIAAGIGMYITSRKS